MPLILAIEPDHKQAAKVTALTRSSLQAELVVVDTAVHALEILASRVPDLILTSTLLSPRDEALLSGRLRELDAAGLPVQTLVIPMLGTASGRTQRRDSSGLFSRLRRTRDPVEPVDGCDPSVFAQQIEEYLERAASDRATVAERDEPVYPGFTQPRQPTTPHEEPGENKTRLSLVQPQVEPTVDQIAATEADETPVLEEEELSHSAESPVDDQLSPAGEFLRVDRDPSETFVRTSVPTEEPEILFRASESILLAQAPPADLAYATTASDEPAPHEREPLDVVQPMAPAEDEREHGQQPEAVVQSVIRAEALSEEDEGRPSRFDDALDSATPEFVIPAPTGETQSEQTIASRETAIEQWDTLEFMIENIERPTEFAIDHTIEEYDQILDTLPLNLTTGADDLDPGWLTEPATEITVIQIDGGREDTPQADFPDPEIDRSAGDVSAEATADVIVVPWEPDDVDVHGGSFDMDPTPLEPPPLAVRPPVDKEDEVYPFNVVEEVAVTIDPDREDTAQVDFAGPTLDPGAGDVSPAPATDVVAVAWEPGNVDGAEAFFDTDPTPLEPPPLAVRPPVDKEDEVYPFNGSTEVDEVVLASQRPDASEMTHTSTAETLEALTVAKPPETAETWRSAKTEPVSAEDEVLAGEPASADEATEGLEASQPEPEPIAVPVPPEAPTVEGLATSATVPLTPPQEPSTTAPNAPAAVVGQVEVIEMLAAIRRDLEQLRQDRVVEPAASGLSGGAPAETATDPVEPDDRGGASESGSPDESNGAARRTKAKTAPSSQKASRSSSSTEKKKKKKRKKPLPIQDEWGFFDPDQCGFAALLEKLEEITEEEANAQGTD